MNTVFNEKLVLTTFHLCNSDYTQFLYDINWYVFQCMGSLEEVAMPQNGINHPGITALAEAFQHNTNLRILNLNDNTFTVTGAKSMAKVFFL